MTEKIKIVLSSAYREYLRQWGLRTGQFQKAAADAWKHKMDKLKDQSKPLDVDAPDAKESGDQPQDPQTPDWISVPPQK